MKNLLLLVLVATSISCAHRVKMMDAGAVSMTHDSLKANESLTPLGKAAGEFCMDSFRDEGTVGIMDEAIKKAQAQSQADFILNASFWRSGKCVIVEGDAAKVVESKPQKVLR